MGADVAAGPKVRVAYRQQKHGVAGTISEQRPQDRKKKKGSCLLVSGTVAAQTNSNSVIIKTAQQ